MMETDSIFEMCLKTFQTLDTVQTNSHVDSKKTMLWSWHLKLKYPLNRVS
jgi:hypothetical protein